MRNSLHSDELHVDLPLVRSRITSVFPEYADVQIERLEVSGSSNVLFRLGSELVVRVPRQPGAGAALAKEHRWLPHFNGKLPAALPEFVALVPPGADVTEYWAISRWLEGDRLRVPAGGEIATDRAALGTRLAEVIIALRDVDVPDAARSDADLRSYRGGPLARFDTSMRANLEACRKITDLSLDLDAALDLWNGALQLPEASKVNAIRWLHGDLVAENLLLRNGELACVLDFGMLSVGDPAVDLHGAFEVLDAPGRDAFRQRLGVDESEWIRGRAWALAIAVGTFAYYWHSMPGRCADRLVMAKSALMDAGRAPA